MAGNDCDDGFSVIAGLRWTRVQNHDDLSSQFAMSRGDIADPV